jgi:hypothetical protein
VAFLGPSEIVTLLLCAHSSGCLVVHLIFLVYLSVCSSYVGDGWNKPPNAAEPSTEKKAQEKKEQKPAVDVENEKQPAVVEAVGAFFDYGVPVANGSAATKGMKKKKAQPKTEDKPEATEEEKIKDEVSFT